VRVLVCKNRPADEKWSQEFRGFLSKCLVKDERGRATTSQLLTEPFVAGCLDAETCKTSVLQLVMELEHSGVGNLDLSGLKEQLAAAVGATFTRQDKIMALHKKNKKNSKCVLKVKKNLQWVHSATFTGFCYVLSFQPPNRVCREPPGYQLWRVGNTEMPERQFTSC
jgi:hypothetical protein